MIGLSWLPTLRSVVRRVLARFRSFVTMMPRSLIAFAVALVLNFLTLGALGGALHFIVGWALPQGFPGLNDWQGDWVWPAMIGVGMLWPAGFLLAGWLNHRLTSRSRPPVPWLRRLGYLLVLWVWAWLLWYVTLATRHSI